MHPSSIVSSPQPKWGRALEPTQTDRMLDVIRAHKLRLVIQRGAAQKNIGVLAFGLGEFFRRFGAALHGRGMGGDRRPSCIESVVLHKN